jgi:hypothetical protein
MEDLISESPSGITRVQVSYTTAANALLVMDKLKQVNSVETPILTSFKSVRSVAERANELNQQLVQNKQTSSTNLNVAHNLLHHQHTNSTVSNSNNTVANKAEMINEIVINNINATKPSTNNVKNDENLMNSQASTSNSQLSNLRLVEDNLISKAVVTSINESSNANAKYAQNVGYSLSETNNENNENVTTSTKTEIRIDSNEKNENEIFQKRLNRSDDWNKEVEEKSSKYLETFYDGKKFWTKVVDEKE